MFKNIYKKTNKTMKFENIVKKHLVIIMALLTFIPCIIPKLNSAHAACNVQMTSLVYLPNGQKMKRVYMPHDALVKAAEDEKERLKTSKWILGLLGLGAKGKIAKCLSAIGLLQDTPSIKGTYETWRKISKDSGKCGVIVRFLWQKHPGGYYAGGGGVTKETEGWDYFGVVAQNK